MGSIGLVFPRPNWSHLKVRRSGMKLADRALASATAASPLLLGIILAGPVIAGLAGTTLPAFGYFPALGGDAFELHAFRDFADEPGISKSVLLSLFTGLAATMAALLVVMAAMGAMGGTRAFSWFTRSATPLLSAPHAAAAFGFLILLAPSGFLARLVSPELSGWTRPPDILFPNDPAGFSLIAGLALKEIPFLLLIAVSAMGQIRMNESRRVVATFGYGRLAGFLLALWPQLYRRMRMPVFAVLAFSVSVVDVAVILGPTSPAPLAVRLMEWINDPQLDKRFMASAGAVVLALTAMAAMGIWLALERAGLLLVAHLCRSGRRFSRDVWARRVIIAIAGLALGILAGGLALLALWSVAGLWQFPDALPQVLTLKSWQAALPQLIGPFWTTTQIAALSAGISLLLVILLLNRTDHGRRDSEALNWLIQAPLIVPQATFLLGLQLIALELSLTPSIPLLAMTHIVFVLPYLFLSLRDPWHGFDRRYEQLAFGMGQSRWRVFWRVRLAMLLKPVLTAFAIGFAVSAGLYLPTALVGAGRLSTITTEAVALASGGSRRVIGVYAFLQAALPFLIFLVAALIPSLLFRNRRAMRH